MLNLIDIETDESAKIHFNKDQIRLIENTRIGVRKTGIKNQELFSKTKEWLKK